MAVIEAVQSDTMNGNGKRVAQPGDRVLIKNLETGDERWVTIVIIPEHEPGPAIRAILGHAVGNVIDIPLKDRLVSHSIRKIETP